LLAELLPHWDQSGLELPPVAILPGIGVGLVQFPDLEVMSDFVANTEVIGHAVQVF